MNTKKLGFGLMRLPHLMLPKFSAFNQNGTKWLFFWNEKVPVQTGVHIYCEVRSNLFF